MVGTRFRTLAQMPLRHNEIETTSPKTYFKINKPVERKRIKTWRSSKSAAMGYFWTKTERGKSWKRWTADKEAYGARWGWYLMNGVNTPYFNPENFIQRFQMRLIENRVRQSTIKGAVNIRIKDIIRETTKNQSAKTEDPKANQTQNSRTKREEARFAQETNFHESELRGERRGNLKNEQAIPRIMEVQEEEATFINYKVIEVMDLVPSPSGGQISPLQMNTNFTSPEIELPIRVALTVADFQEELNEEQQIANMGLVMSRLREGIQANPSKTIQMKAELDIDQDEPTREISKVTHIEVRKGSRRTRETQKQRKDSRTNREESRRNYSTVRNLENILTRADSKKARLENTRERKRPEETAELDDSGKIIHWGIRTGRNVSRIGLILASAGVSLPPE